MSPPDFSFETVTENRVRPRKQMSRLRLLLFVSYTCLLRRSNFLMSTTQLTQQEKQACIILSELFLDTELTQLALNHITSSLRPLGIPVPTLEHMLRYDVFPILSPNLLSITGEWQGVDEDWLLRGVQARRSAAGSGWVKSGVDFVAWHSLGGRIRSIWDDVKEGLNESNARL